MHHPCRGIPGRVFIAIGLSAAGARASSIEAVHGFQPHFVCPPGTMANIRTDFGARGDGVSDDTAAFLKAFGQDPPRSIYIPAGTYLLREQIRYGVNAEKKKRVCIMGECRSRTIIRLADNSPGFGDPSRPKPFFHTRHPDQQGEQNMHQYLYHLTFEIGRGNPGAIGLNYHSNNTGAIKDVTIRAADPARHPGHIGLDCSDWDVGPANARYLTVEGFRTGIALTRIGNYFTLEHATVRHCGTGLLTDTASVRHLNAEDCGLPVRCEGQVVLLDSELRGQGDVAIDDSDCALLARRVRTSGYRQALRSGGAVGPEIGHFASGRVLSNWPPGPGRAVSLDLPVEESPELQYPQSHEDWAVMPASGDISDPLQRAIDAGKRHVYLQGGSRITRTIRLRNQVRRIMGLGVSMVRFETADAPAFRLEEGEPPEVIVELIYPDYGSTSRVLFEQAARRTLVCRHGGGSYRTAPRGRGGRVFIESLVGYPFRFTGVQAWVRDLDTEQGGPDSPNVVNDGGTLWILGHKTEDFATKIRTTGGGFTELLGGTYRQNWDDADFAQAGIDPTRRPPLFEILDSQASLTYHSWGPAHAYTQLVRETRNGETRNLERSTHGGDATLFVGWQARPAPER